MLAILIQKRRQILAVFLPIPVQLGCHKLCWSCDNLSSKNSARIFSNIECLHITYTTNHHT